MINLCKRPFNNKKLQPIYGEVTNSNADSDVNCFSDKQQLSSDDTDTNTNSFNVTSQL